MKLYSIAGTCAVSVSIVLAWIQEPFELEVMQRGDNTAPAYLAMNPTGQVPALRLEGGEILTEAAAILTYLAACFPASGLGGDPGPRSRYALSEVLSFLTSEVHVAFKPFFAPQRFLDDTAQFEALRTKAFDVIHPLMAILEQRLGSGSHLLGNRRTVADAYLYVLLRWMEEAPGGLRAYPRLGEFRERMQADPGVRSALEAHGMAPV